MAGNEKIAFRQRHEHATPIIERHLGMPLRTLAKILHRDLPHLFVDVENARSYLRKRLFKEGKSSARRTGKQLEQHMKEIKQYYGVTVADGWPEAVVEQAWLPFQLPDVNGTSLLMADLHIPFHDHKSLMATIKYAKDLGKNLKCIVLDGDVSDQYSNSWWAIDPLVTTLDKEIKAVRQFFCMLRAEFPKVEIVWKMANHEDRFDKTIRSLRPSLAESEEIRGRLKFIDILSQNDNEKIFDGIHIVPAGDMMYHKELAIVHGDEFGGGFSTPVNPARTAFLKAKSCVLQAHSHRASNHVESDIWGAHIAAWSIGCLCNLHPRWKRMAHLTWQHGFALLHTKGSWVIDNKRIIGDKVVGA